MARNRRLIATVSVLLFVAALVGAYFVRRHQLERAMISAMELEDKAAIAGGNLRRLLAEAGS